MNQEPAVHQDRSEDAEKHRELGDSARVAVRRRWLIAGLALLLLVALVVALGVASARQARLRRIPDLVKLGTTAYARGEFAHAETALAELAALRSDDATTQALLGRSREAQGDLAGATAAYAASLAANAKQPDTLYRLAVVQKSTGKRDEAVATLKLALAADAGFFPARLLLASLYEGAGANADARSQLDAVIRLHPIGVDIKALATRRDALK